VTGVVSGGYCCRLDLQADDPAVGRLQNDVDLAPPVVVTQVVGPCRRRIKA
jgi:hypothetical protein